MRAVFFVFPLLFVAQTAAAQPYVVSTQSAAFVPVSSGTPVQLTGTIPTDNGRATIPIGFDFPFFGQSYSQLTVTANGVAVFEPGACATCDFAQNSALPDPAAPNGVLAPFWDDLKLSWPTSGIFYTTRSTTTDAGMAVETLVIEWRELNHWFATSQHKITVQLQLSSTGEIAFHYGPHSGSGAALSATVGIEGPSGTSGNPALSCTPSCGASALTTNQRIVFSAPAALELSVARVVLDSVGFVSDGGAELEVKATSTLRNFSQADATGVSYALFLSQDRAYSPLTDIPMTPNTLGPVDVPALGTTEAKATATVGRPASGKWFVISFADPFSAITEPDETNNASATVDSFAATVDLSPLALAGPSITGPGEAVTLSLKLENAGVMDAGAAPVAVKLAADGAPDAGGFAVYSGQVSIGAREKKDTALSFSMPSNVPAGEFRWQVQLDPANAVSEDDEANNVLASGGKVTVAQNDLFVRGLTALKPTPPFDPAVRLFFGEPGRFDVTVSNIGGAGASNATLSLYLSANGTFNALSDTRFLQQPLSVAAGQTRTVSITATLPTVDKNGVAYADGEYHVIALVVAPSDPDALNDIGIHGPQRISLPGPDLIVRSLSSTPIVASGERFLISRRMSNAGTRDAGVASYRYFLSPNDIVSVNDVPVPLLDGGTGAVSLAAGQDSIDTDHVAVPQNVPEGLYYLSAIVDSAGAVAEFDEKNNELAGPQLLVLGSSLRLDSQYLPDAIVDRTYRAELSAHGGAEAITYGSPSMPMGLTLASDGVIAGTPTQGGVFGIPIILTSGSRTTRATAVLRVLPSSTVLDVVTTTLPPIAREHLYDVQLTAQGGARPYRWKLVGGALPFGISLTESGELRGITFAGSGQFTFTAKVSDGFGTSVERVLRVRVVASGALVLQTSAPPPAPAGIEFATDFYAVNASGAPLATALRWSVVEGELPPGLRLDPRDQLLLVRGVPSRIGNYPLVLGVEDLEGRSDTVSVVFQVLGSSSLIAAQLPQRVRPGDEVEGRLISDGALQFRIASGELPPGVQLNGAGEIFGRVDEAASPGTYSFTASAVDVLGIERLGAFGLEVMGPDVAPPKRCGCDAASSLGPMVALLTLAGLRRRRA